MNNSNIIENKQDFNFQGFNIEQDLKMSIREKKQEQNCDKILDESEKITDIVQNINNNYRNKSFTNFTNYKTEPLRNISPIITNNTNKSFNGTCSGGFPKEFFSTHSRIKRKFDVKFIKSEKKKEPKWKELKIEDLVNKDRLETENPFIMIFKGELMKYSFSNDPKLFINYSQRLCILTKSEFILFHSKESFLRLQKPTMKIELKDIIDYGRIDPRKEKFKTKKEFFYFFMKLVDKNVVTNIKKNTKIDENKDTTNKNINSYIQIKIKNLNNNCMSPVKNTKINLICVQNKSKTQEKVVLINENKRNEDNIHIFASTNEDIINKWIFLIDYFKLCLK